MLVVQLLLQVGWAKTWGVTLGNYINGGTELEASAENPVFRHEYGHYIQSQLFGVLYISHIAIPSLYSSFNASSNFEHEDSYVEQDANYRSHFYFNDMTNNYFEWDYEKILINRYNNPGTSYYLLKSNTLESRHVNLGDDYHIQPSNMSLKRLRNLLSL